MVPVVLYHADLGFPGGYVGVDVFFVISGYLITSLILKDLAVGNFSLLEFWARRVRRIIPAVTIVMVACLVAGSFILWPADYQDLGQSAVAQSLFVSNFYFWLHSGYFEDSSVVRPLLHTWSLSVEEQFYVLFPLALLILAKYASKLRFRVLGIVAFLSFLLSVYGSYQHPSATFYLIPTRAWELLAGTLLAMAGSRVAFLNSKMSEALSCAGLGLIGLAAIFYGSDTRFPGLAAVVPVLGTLLVIISNSVRLTRTGRLLAWKPVVFIGLISYSWYLWHWPLLVFSQYWSLDSFDVSSRIALVAISVVLAAASWRFIEIPFRNSRPAQRRSRVLAYGALALLTISISGYLISESEGVASRVPPEAAEYAAGKKDRAFIQEVSVADAVAGRFVQMGSVDPGSPVNTLVWGDSHAMAVMPAIDRLCKEWHVRCVGATHSSTAPLHGFISATKYGLNEESIIFNDAVLDFVEHFKIQNVLLVALWRGYGLESDEAHFKQLLQKTVERINRAGAKAWIMVEAPSHDVDVPRALARAALAGQDVETLGVMVAEQEQKVAWQREVFTSIGDALVVLEPLNYLAADNGFCRVADSGRSLYSDNHHLSVTGAMMIRAMFEPLFSGSG